MISGTQKISQNVWKTSLTRQIIHLEDNLDQIFFIVGLKAHRIVREEEKDEVLDGITKAQPEIRDYESILDEQILEIERAADNICALTSSVTDFDLPLPVLVLLKIANRVGSIRCLDFKKRLPGSQAKKYIYYKRSLHLIHVSLSLYECMTKVLKTNILPFQQYVNREIFSLLAWTRSSNLLEHDSESYFRIRIQVLSLLSRLVECFSLNINLDSKELNALLEQELIGDLEEILNTGQKPYSKSAISNITSTPNQTTNGKISHAESSKKSEYICEILRCLDRIFLVYADYLGAKVELKFKKFIVNSCINIYRDFEQNVMEIACRRLLIRLLETIANRPYATSTTELAWHVFELCERMETDQEIRYIARRSLKNGLAHRPIVVSHFEVHDNLGEWARADESIAMECSDNLKDQPQIMAPSHIAESTLVDISPAKEAIKDTNPVPPLAANALLELEDIPEKLIQNGSSPSVDPEQSVDQPQAVALPQMIDMPQILSPAQAKESMQTVDAYDSEEGDEQVKPYLDLFVDSLVGHEEKKQEDN